jgi:hypothetical protein
MGSMSESRALTELEFTKVQGGQFPSLQLAADQWGERGYFYDPIRRHFAWYEIDRKDQVDAMAVIGGAAELLRSCFGEALARVTAWLAAMPSDPCSRCAGYFGEWRSHSPTFPTEAFEVIDAQSFEVGTHGAATGMEGVARCRGCGLFAAFGCTYGPGYSLTPQPAKG